MWFRRCDQCGKCRWVGTYYEVYPPLGSKGDAAGWWYACADCLLDMISDRLDDGREIMIMALQELVGDRIDGTWDETVDRLREHLRDAILCEVRCGRLTINGARELLGLARLEIEAEDAPEEPWE